MSLMKLNSHVERRDTMARTPIGNLTNEISKALKEYTTEVEEGLEKAKKKVVQEGVKTLKATSPKQTGKYAKGWAVTNQDGAQVIHNATRPSLTHLLENGHALRSGGRTRAIKHIEPVEQSVINNFEKEVEKVIKK